MRYKQMTWIGGVLILIAGACGQGMAAETTMDKPVLIEVRTIWDQRSTVRLRT